MGIETSRIEPDLCQGLTHFHDDINRRIIQSEIEGGVHLSDLPEGARLEIETQNRFYTVVHQGNGRALISGHPEFCPEPVEMSIHGSTWGGSMIKRGFIGRGMHLELGHPKYRGRVITSEIKEIRELEDPDSGGRLPLLQQVK